MPYILSILLTSMYVSLKATLRGRFDDYALFTEKETEAHLVYVLVQDVYSMKQS